jgi:hypothetical protein
MHNIRLKAAAPWIACTLLCLLNTSSLAYAKKVFSVEGRIQDELGTGVWGARVELKETTNKSSVKTTSTDNGSFRFARVPAGEYQIAVRREGFVTSFLPISVPLSSHAQLKLSLVKENNRAHVGPEVIVTEPFDMVPLQHTVKVSAKGTDSKGITRMEIYIDGELEASTYSDSIAVLWDSTAVPNGSHTVFAKAYNGTGEASQSETTILFVDNH